MLTDIDIVICVADVKIVNRKSIKRWWVVG